MTRESIRARVAAATPGPWRAEYGIVWAGDSSIGEMDDDQDAPLVAHARQDIPLLLAVADAVAALSEVHENTAAAVADGVTPLADLLTALEQRAKAWADVLDALAALEAGR